MEEHIHFIGIGGAGMSGLARVLARQGVHVTGSDLRESPTLAALRREGDITATAGHHASNVRGAGLVVVSAAVRGGNPEIEAAREAGIPIISRAEMLGLLMRRSARSIAVTGTHGKTTTTGMIATMLAAAGLDPTVLIGGDLPQFGGNARLGDSDLFLTEACEAYDSFLDLNPQIAVVTNIEADHLDYYGDLHNVLRSFRQFLSQVSGTAVMCYEDDNIQRLIAGGCGVPACLTYGLGEDADLRARDVSMDGMHPSYVVYLRGERLGTVTLAVPGRHNILNSLAAVGVGLTLDVPFARIADGLAGFTGTGRRFERLGETAAGVLVIDDYAHHPTEIRATLAAARGAFPDRRIVAVFQPHLPSRTQDFKEDFAESFGDADFVVLTDIFLAREQPIEGVTGAGLAALTADRRGAQHVAYVGDKSLLAGRLLDMVGPGDVLLTLGAGDIRVVAEEFLSREAVPGLVGGGMTKRKVAVLMGGTSAEREVSLSTGRQILNALDPDRYIVYALDTAAGQDFLPAERLGAMGGLQSTVHALHASDGVTEVTALPQLPQVAPDDRPDVVFIALHGPGGEDGTVQGMLEVLGVPYTGSGVLASALAMDKAMTKRVLASVGVRVPQDVTVRRGDYAASARAASLTLPVIVKPNGQGSTIGMSVVRDPSEMEAALLAAFRHDDAAIVEDFVSGTEITVPVLGNDELEVLPLVEIVPSGGFYDYQAKYTPGATDEIVPARIPEAVAAEARRIAVLCHRTLGCRGMSRTDMIVTHGGEIHTLEVNTIPGMTPTSLLPRSAEAAGIPFPRLLDRLIDLALEPRHAQDA